MILPALQKVTTFPVPLRLPAVAFVASAQMAGLNLLVYAIVAFFAQVSGIKASSLLLSLAVLIMVPAVFMALSGAVFLALLVARDLGAGTLWTRLSGTCLGRAAGHLALGGSLNAVVGGTVAAFVGWEEPQFVVIAALGVVFLCAALICALIALYRTRAA